MESRFTHLIYDNSPVWLQNAFVSLVGYLENRRRFNKEFWHFLDFLQESTRYSEEELKAYQRQELRRLIRHAYNTVPYYQHLLKELKLTPEDISEQEDLKKLPILTKEELKANFHDFLSTSYSKKSLVPVHTSGTTGTAMKFFWTNEGLAREFAFAWARRRQGVNLGNLHATFNARNVVPVSQNKPPFWRTNGAANQVLFSHYHINPTFVGSYLDELARRPFVYYEGYASAIFLLADYALVNNLDIGNYPKGVYTSSETLLDWQRQAIEKAFHTHVFDSYGSAEQASLAVQCSANNYHFVPEYGIVELLPIEENPTYIRAEIVSTSFLNMAMPMIRYRLNDHVMMYKGKSCPCGRPGHVIKQIDGRIEDVIVTPEGNLIGRMDHIFKDMVNIKESQIVQDSIDSLTVKVVKRPSYTGRDEDTLMHELTSRLGKHISIRFDYMEFIPRTASGKFRAVVSHLKPEQRRLNAATSSNTKRNG